MPKISTLGQKLWPTGREQIDTQTHTQTHRQRKQTLRTLFFDFFFFIFDFLLKGAVRYYFGYQRRDILFLFYFSAVKMMQSSAIHFQNIQDLLKNSMFMKQQISYEEERR